MMEIIRQEDLDNIVAKVIRKDLRSEGTCLVSHDEDHSYQGVLLTHKVMYLTMKCENDNPITNDEGNLFLAYCLHFSVSHWTDVPDDELVQRYKKVVPVFDDICNKISVQNTLNIIYSKTIYSKNLLKENPNINLLMYHPLGFETYTCFYTRLRESEPEVINVFRAQD